MSICLRTLIRLMSYSKHLGHMSNQAQSQYFFSEVNCGLPDRIRHGYARGMVYTYGSVVEYSCMNRYHLVGNKSRTCLANSKWSGAAPKCEGKIIFCLGLRTLYGT